MKLKKDMSLKDFVGGKKRSHHKKKPTIPTTWMVSNQLRVLREDFENFKSWLERKDLPVRVEKAQNGVDIITDWHKANEAQLNKIGGELRDLVYALAASRSAHAALVGRVDLLQDAVDKLQVEPRITKAGLEQLKSEPSAKLKIAISALNSAYTELAKAVNEIDDVMAGRS